MSGFLACDVLKFSIIINKSLKAETKLKKKTCIIHFKAYILKWGKAMATYP
jgi:hypothetical protein